MKSHTSKISWFGLFLVGFGIVLLLRSQNLIDLPFRAIVWPFLLLVGLIVAGRGFAENGRGKIVAGTVIFLYSLFFTIRSLDFVHLSAHLALPAGLMILGIAGLMLVVNNRRDWYYLLPAVLLIVSGSGFIMSDFGMISGWELRNAVRTWWPLALILTGAAMLARRGSRAARSEAEGILTGDPTT